MLALMASFDHFMSGFVCPPLLIKCILWNTDGTSEDDVVTETPHPLNKTSATEVTGEIVVLLASIGPTTVKHNFCYLLSPYKNK